MVGLNPPGYSANEGKGTKGPLEGKRQTDLQLLRVITHGAPPEPHSRP